MFVNLGIITNILSNQVSDWNESRAEKKKKTRQYWLYFSFLFCQEAIGVGGNRQNHWIDYSHQMNLLPIGYLG